MDIQTATSHFLGYLAQIDPDTNSTRDSETSSRTMTTAEAIERFIRSMKRVNYSPGTANKYQLLLNRYLVYLHTNAPYVAANVAASELRVLNDFIDYLDTQSGKARALKSRANDMGVLRSFGRFLIEEEDLLFVAGNNPYLRLRKPRLTKTIPRSPETNDVLKVLKQRVFMRSAKRFDVTNPYKVWQNERNKLIVFTLCITGLRSGEMRGLTWQDVPLTPGKAYIHVINGKGGKDRFVPIPTNLAGLYSNYRQLERARSRGQDTDFIFLAHLRGVESNPVNPISGQGVFEIVRDVFRDQLPGFTHVWPHLLRHAALTALVESGADIVTVASIAGHSSIETTYQHYVAPRDRRKAVALENSPMNEGFS